MGKDTLSSKNQVRICLIVDKLLVSKYTYDFVKWCINNENIVITHIIIQTKEQTLQKPKIKKRILNSIQARMWNLIQIIERRRLSKKNANHQKLYSLEKFKFNEINIKVIASKSGLVHRFSDLDVNRIKREKFDFIYRACNGILRGKILNAANHGILSFHHGDNRVNRGGPAGWWEVFLKEATTGFTLQILKDELDGGDVIVRGNFPTKIYFLENQAEIQRRSLFYLYKFLNEIAIEGKPNTYEKKLPYYMPIYRQPKILDLCLYIIYLIKLSLISNFNKLLNINEEKNWQISYINRNWRETALWRSKTVENNKDSYFADPFLVSKDKVTFCFCEEIDKKTNKGVISLIEISEENDEYKGVVLEEPFHLSFPFVFVDEGRTYMIPESSENNDIRLYECTKFPNKWELKKVLIKNISATDSIIFFKDSKYWLLTNSSISDQDEHSSELLIFHSDSLISENWIPHKKNPVMIDANFARNAGYIYEDDDIFRVSQKRGFNKYGAGININKVITLTMDDYEEELVAEILPKFKKKIKGTHHITSNKHITIIDHY